jgi:hypothetical protein
MDTEHVYSTIENSDNRPWQLKNTKETVNGSLYEAADLRKGEVLWGTTLSQDGVVYGPSRSVGDIVIQNAPVSSSSRGLVMEQGALVFLYKVTGKFVGRLATHAPTRGGFVVQDKHLLFGTGYQSYSGSRSLYVVKVN